MFFLDINSFIHRQQLLYQISIVFEAWNFVLSANSAFASEPVVKEVLTGEGDFGGCEREVFVTFGVVIGVETFEFVVENIGKCV